MPSGFLQTRADLLMDVVFICVLATPCLLLLSFRLARTRRVEQHKRVQIVLLSVLLTGVLLFELDVRLAGGSGSLMRGSSYAGTEFLRWLTIAHVSGSVATFILWLVLVVTSLKRFDAGFASLFRRKHRLAGKWVFAGSLYTAFSAIAMYTFGFIL